MQKNGASGSRMEEKSCLRTPNSITPVSTARIRDKMLCSKPGHTPRTKPQAPISLMSPPPMARVFPCVSNAANRYGPPVTRSPATEAAGRSSIKPQTQIMAGIRLGISRSFISQSAAQANSRPNTTPFTIRGFMAPYHRPTPDPGCPVSRYANHRNTAVPQAAHH